ncbi:MAG: hypothetical protein QG597_2367 [Actinomycetota bacterium]|nr:hypothetical protein [Actinomycetota bacterium]
MAERLDAASIAAKIRRSRITEDKIAVALTAAGNVLNAPCGADPDHKATSRRRACPHHGWRGTDHALGEPTATRSAKTHSQHSAK